MFTWDPKGLGHLLESTDFMLQNTVEHVEKHSFEKT